MATLAAERAVRSLVGQKLRTLLVFRQASPFGHGGLEERLLGSAECGVYDFDDGLLWDTGRPSNPGNLLRSSADKCMRSVKRADRVIAGNDYLADWSSQYARDVVVIPSCVEPQIYRVKGDYELGDPPRLVWIGSPSSENYLRAIEGALLAVHGKTGARLTIIGDAGARLEGPLESMTDRVQWREGRAEQQLAEFDVGLGPLTDDRFSAGKSAYKLLQYGAAGLPFVASPVGTNETVTTALGGRPATDEAEWIDQLTAVLHASAGERRVGGQRAREVVGARTRSMRGRIAGSARSICPSALSTASERRPPGVESPRTSRPWRRRRSELVVTGPPASDGRAVDLLVTGGAGFIGSNFVHRVVAHRPQCGSRSSTC